MKSIYYIFTSLLLLSSCASIQAPTGGDKDVNAPELLSKKINSTSTKTTENTTIEFNFNEFIQLNKIENYFYTSPPFKKRARLKVKQTTLLITIEDTLLENTTYNIVLDNCIKDNNEGNVLDTLNYIFSTAETIQDSLSIKGNLRDAYTLKPIDNAWVMLYDTLTVDSLIFKDNPNYVAKSNKNGYFNFPNLNNKYYRVVALTGSDFVYDEKEQIAFYNNSICALKDSAITLNCFNPLIETDSLIIDTTSTLKNDSTILAEVPCGKLTISSNKLEGPLLFQLLQNNKIMHEYIIETGPYTLININPGKYQLKCIFDANYDAKWNTGDWELRKQAETVINYPAEITIRSNWDMELLW